jgi:predicted metal-dependent hydrolase
VGGTAAVQECVVVLDDIGPVRFERSGRARHVSISVRSSGGVRVAVPGRMSFEQARRFALSRQEWIRRTLRRVERARERCREAVLAAENLDRGAARLYLAGRLAALAEEHGYLCGRLCVRNQGTLWGSASPRGNIQLNARLAVLPLDLADYVMIHELVHTVVKGHGRTFWKELERRLPDARRRQKQLREYSLALF